MATGPSAAAERVRWALGRDERETATQMPLHFGRK
jgi:hypothetical protein